MKTRVLAVLLVLCASLGLAACKGKSAASPAVSGSTAPSAQASANTTPGPVAAQWVAAIQSADYATAGRLAGVAPATIQAPYAQLLTALKAPAVVIKLDAVTEDADNKHASAPFHTTITPAGYAPWTYDGTLPLLLTGKTWSIQWSLSLVHPQLVAGDQIALHVTVPARASVTGAGGATLVGAGTVYQVGIDPGRMNDPKAELAILAKLLKPQGITAAELQADYTAGLAHPNQKYDIITLREHDFDPIEPQLYELAGVPYTKVTSSLAQTPTFARALLGRVGNITADGLKTLGAGYTASSQVGLFGLEKTYETRLAGTPSAVIVLANTIGTTLSTLQSYPGVAGQPVALTLDPKIQAAAEKALGTVDSPTGDVTALVAIQPSTGNILAVANRPSASGFDSALEGTLPPGSTFKVVSTAGLLTQGVTPSTAVPCIPIITIGGESFHNFQGEQVAGTVPFSQDFAISCNTAFISLSPKLAGGVLAKAAAEFGLGAPWHIGVAANTGSVPAPKDAAELASATIGQGEIAVSPLDMAMVAAAVQSGTWRAPRLVTDPAPAGSPPPAALPAAIVDPLRTLMAGVVTSGTAAPAFKNFPGPPVSGKTGTAETADKTLTDAWFMGFRGDLAFAVVVQNGGVGGVVAAPIAAKFLAAIG